MTVEELVKLFDKHEGAGWKRDDGLGFTDAPLGARQDLHAFKLLDRLLPPLDGKPDKDRIINGAEHDIIWLSPSLEDLAASGITELEVRELVRCGVHIDTEVDSLAMFR